MEEKKVPEHCKQCGMYDPQFYRLKGLGRQCAAFGKCIQSPTCSLSGSKRMPEHDKGGR